MIERVTTSLATRRTRSLHVRWSPREENGTRFHEVVVVAEHLDRSAEAIVETLLHEAAHALNFARGSHDCSASQYHNAHFKAAAEELGLVVTQVQHYGFAKTSMPVETVKVYEEEVRRLEEVLVHRRKPPAARVLPTRTPGNGDTTKEGSQGRSRKATCACRFIIRVSRKTMQDTVIRCSRCGEPFCFS